MSRNTNIIDIYCIDFFLSLTFDILDTNTCFGNMWTAIDTLRCFIPHLYWQSNKNVFIKKRH